MSPEDLRTLALQLTGDSRRAATLLGEVTVRSEGRAGEDDPDRLGLLVSRHLRAQGRRRPADHDRIDLEGGEQPSDPQAVLARVDQLAPLPRAALVLRQHDLTLPELAALLDRPVPTVARVLSAAESTVHADPRVLAAAFAPLPPVSDAAVDAETRQYARNRRRRRGRVLAGVVAATMLLVGGIVVPQVLERRATYVRPYGAWVHGFGFEPAAGWRLGGRTLAAGRDSLTVYLGPDERRSCLIDLITFASPPTAPEGERFRVQGRAAVLVRSTGPAAPYLWWTVAPEAAAVVGCTYQADSKTLLDLAGRVRLRAEPLLLPFAIGAVGDGVQVRFVSTRGRTQVALSVPPGQVSRSGATIFVSVPGTDRIAEDQSRRTQLTVQGGAGTLERGRNGGLALCWPVQSSRACVTSYVFRESTDPQQTRLRSQLTAIADGLRFAPQLDDSSTWYDATAVLPR